MRELKAVTFAFFVEGAFEIEEGIFSAYPGAGVTKNEEIHKSLLFYRLPVTFVG
jgi:hypothetical protein